MRAGPDDYSLIAKSRQNKHISYTVVITLAILCFQDPMLLLVSRLCQEFSSPPYLTYPVTIESFAKLLLYSIFSFLAAFVVALSFKPVRKISVSTVSYKAFIFLAIFLNFVSFILVPHHARYTSGALTGGIGMLLMLSDALTFLSMLIYVKNRLSGNPVKLDLTLLLIVTTMILKIDGLARVLTIFAFLYLLFPVKRLRGMVIAGVMVSCLLYLGLMAKFGGGLGGLTVSEFLFWVIQRFAINAENLNTVLSGHSMISGVADYYGIVVRSFEYRVDLLLHIPVAIISPKSISEAMYYDLYNKFGSGSSPGFLLSSILAGGPLLFFIFPAMYAYILKMFFGSLSTSFGIIEICLFIYLIKGVVADFSEVQIIISPSFMYFCGLVFTAFTRTKVLNHPGLFVIPLPKKMES